MNRRITALLLTIAFIMLPIAAFADDGFSANPKAIDKAAKSVLMLQVFDADNEMIATGSGFVAFNNRTIVTNHHVIEDADWMMANSDDGYQYMVTKVLTADEEKDIAICEFMSPTDLQPLEFNVDGELLRAENVVAIGSPKGFTNTVSLGNISAIYKDESLIQFTAPISHGSSGGALFDDSGQVIGITSSGFDDAQNLNFAIHISEVEALYNNWDGTTSNFDEFIAIAKATPTPVPTVIPTPMAPKSYKILTRGASGINVMNLQEALIELGYMNGYPSGYYNYETEMAVSLFNQVHFSKDSTVADKKMQALLFEGRPQRNEKNIAFEQQPVISPICYPILKEGSKGKEVMQLQEMLINLGYLSGAADGIFGEQTKNAVILFTTQNGREVSEYDAIYGTFSFDGIATNSLQQFLFSGTAPKCKSR